MTYIYSKIIDYWLSIILTSAGPAVAAAVSRNSGDVAGVDKDGDNVGELALVAPLVEGDEADEVVAVEVLELELVGRLHAGRVGTLELQQRLAAPLGQQGAHVARVDEPIVGNGRMRDTIRFLGEESHFKDKFVINLQTIIQWIMEVL